MNSRVNFIFLRLQLEYSAGFLYKNAQPNKYFSRTRSFEPLWVNIGLYYA